MIQDDGNDKKNPGTQTDETQFDVKIRFEDENGDQHVDSPAAQQPESSENSEPDLMDAINDLREQIKALSGEFEAKLKYDQHKNKIIDGLHQDLQGYREGLIKKHFHSMITDAIKIVDDIRKLKTHYEDEPPTEETLPTLLKFLEDIASDIEDLFSWQGVVPFTCGTQYFDSTRQRVVKKIETFDPDMDKKVAASIRPGYKLDDKVLRPEMVTVYVYNNESAQEGSTH